MTTQRLSAKDAIAALRAHQLQTVNAEILNEISAIRKDLNDWRLQLDEAQKDIQTVTDKSHEVHGTIQKHAETLSQLETGHKGHEQELESLRASGIALEERVSKTVSVSDATKLQHEDLIGELRQELVQLGDKIRQLEEWQIQVTDELRRDIAERGGRVNIEELEDKLEDFIQEVDIRFQGLQKDNGHADSFTNSHANRDEVSQPVDSASALMGSSHLTKTTRIDSDADRWKPIDTQTAFRATPPPQPETVPFVRRGDSYVQTPSTFRSAGADRDNISNIAHNRLADSELQALASKDQAFLDGLAGELKQQRDAKRCRRIEEDTDWHTLSLLLGLRQGQKETLTHYLTRLRDALVSLGPDPDIISACLRRLVCGVTDPRSKAFMRDWLTTSEWTLENIQDCILLLTKCCGRQRTVKAVTNPAAQTNKEVFTDRCHIGHGLDLRDAAQSVSGEHNPVEDSPGSIQNVAKSRVRDAVIQQRSQPARAAKISKVKNVQHSKGQCREVIDKASLINEVDGQQSQEEIPALTRQVAPEPVADPASEAGPAKEVTRKQKHSRKGGVCQRELKSLLGTKTIEKSAPPPLTASLKRKTLHQPEQSIPQTAPAEYAEPPEPPSSRVKLLSKRIPKLVPRRTAKAASVAEPNDAVGLPPIPGAFDGQAEEGNNSNVEDIARKRIRKARPDLPVLSLSASDFQS